MLEPLSYDSHDLDVRQVVLLLSKVFGSLLLVLFLIARVDLQCLAYVPHMYCIINIIDTFNSMVHFFDRVKMCPFQSS